MKNLKKVQMDKKYEGDLKELDLFFTRIILQGISTSNIGEEFEMAKKFKAMDGNSAVTHVAHAVSEVIAIYPITPSSVMGEVADAKSAAGETNIFGSVPEVAEMQSEAGAAGAVHGALLAGSLSTTFTASQGLLLMIPTMHKVAGELLPTVFHVSARSLACQALSIFGDHSDVMNCRTTGYCMMPSSSVQEAHDIAMISHAAALECSLPFLHFFDGFRTSSEIQKITLLSKDEIASMMEQEFIVKHRNRALSPDHPCICGTSQNPDVYFQGRETVNQYYDRVPAIVEKYMAKFERIAGRKYELFQYVGAPDAEKVLIIMGSGAETADETVEILRSRGEKVGVLKIRLYRPFSVKHFAAALPKTTKKIAVLDRTKEPGCLGEPLYLDIVSAMTEMFDEGIAPFTARPLIVGGRYGLSSKEFTPGMVKAVFDNLDAPKPKNHFTIGIVDDVTNTSLAWDETISSFCSNAYQAQFWGLGSDGTVSANKNTIKIISEATDKYCQAYFVYDSKKAGARTTSHLRFGDSPIKSTYLCQGADFLACHNWSFIERYDMLKNLKEGGTFLLNAPFGPEEVWEHLPAKIQCQLAEKKIKFYVINAYEVAKKLKLGARINTLMQTAFFKISGVLPQEKAIELIKSHTRETYARKGEEVVRKNFEAIDSAVEATFKVKYDDAKICGAEMPPVVPSYAPDFVKDVTAKIIALEGDSLKVSDMPPDGKWISGTTQYEKRNIATEIPVWESALCLQCGMCSLVCPHAAIRTKVYDATRLEKAPAAFKSIAAKTKQFEGKMWTVQIAPEDCTGCGVCVEACPAKDKADPTRKAINLASQLERRENEAKNWDFFLTLPEADPTTLNKSTVKGSQLLRPLFEFSGACAGCGETPYIKLATQLFGERMLIANATGCSSIYGGNLPTTPYCKNAEGLGPAWANSLFEDNAEAGFGFKLSTDQLNREAHDALARATYIPQTLKDEIVAWKFDDTTDYATCRLTIAKLRELALANGDNFLASVADYLVKKSVWVVGGDGWAYDIGYGGLDHVLAMGKDINLLVLDTEVYSNTGGQMSKSTPRGATARFAEAGKGMPKKDLGMIAQTYGYIYVAQIAMGANPAHAVKAFIEAESYPGPSLIIAYSPCISHGFRDMRYQLDEQRKAVDTGHWVLYRFDPRRAVKGENPLQVDSKEPSLDPTEYLYGENRFKALVTIDPKRADMLLQLAKKDMHRRWNLYSRLAALDYSWAKEDK